jgi:hypothetical protein
MSGYLLTIVGTSILGVLIELLLTDSPMSKFVRSIYAFFVLFIILSPVPKFLSAVSVFKFNSIQLNGALITETKVQTDAERANLITNRLNENGFSNCIVVFFDGKIYINALESPKNDTEAIINIARAVVGSAAQIEVFS